MRDPSWSRKLAGRLRKTRKHQERAERAQQRQRGVKELLVLGLEVVDAQHLFIAGRARAVRGDTHHLAGPA
jgi:hypothetical protein